MTEAGGEGIISNPRYANLDEMISASRYETQREAEKRAERERNEKQVWQRGAKGFGCNSASSVYDPSNPPIPSGGERGVASKRMSFLDRRRSQVELEREKERRRGSEAHLSLMLRRFEEGDQTIQIRSKIGAK